VFSRNEAVYQKFIKARADNSYFKIQQELKNWLGNKETPKFFLSILAHDLTLQIIDNYLLDKRENNLADTTFF